MIANIGARNLSGISSKKTKKIGLPNKKIIYLYTHIENNNMPHQCGDNELKEKNKWKSRKSLTQRSENTDAL